MKTLTLNLLLVVVFSSILFSCEKEDDGIYFNETSEVIETKTTYTDIEKEIIELINDYRISIGVPALCNLNIISGVAQGHTTYMVETGEVSHNNFDERAQNLIENAGAKSVGENIAYGYNSAQGAVTGWLNSDSHRKVIESASYTHFGISTKSNDEGRNYFTQIFIKK